MMDFVVTEEAIARAYNGRTQSSETFFHTEKLQHDVVRVAGPVEIDQEVTQARVSSDQNGSGRS